MKMTLLALIITIVPIVQQFYKINTETIRSIAIISSELKAQRESEDSFPNKATKCLQRLFEERSFLLNMGDFFDLRYILERERERDQFMFFLNTASVSNPNPLIVLTRISLEFLNITNGFVWYKSLAEYLSVHTR